MKKISICMMMTTMFFVTSLYAKEKPEVKVVEVAQDADAANDGVVFSLPTTMIRVRVEAEVEISKVGPFYRYSNKYLNLTDVVTEDNISWKLVSASITAYGKALDQNAKKYKMTSSYTECPSISTTSDGVIMGINVDCQQFENEEADSHFELPKVSFDDVQLDRSILTKTSTAAMAEETALSIYTLRDKRLSLLGGEEPVVLNDAGSYDRIFNEIDRLEKDLISMFAGKKVKARVVKYYDVMPDNYGVASQVLLRFSEKDGFLDPMDLNGKPVYIDMSFAKQVPVNSYPPMSKERRAKALTGLRYIQPTTVNVKIIDRNKLICEEDVLCAQGGQIMTLPADLLTDKTVSIKFNTSNGSLEYIKYNR